MDVPTLPLVSLETLLSLKESLGGEQDLCRNFVSRYVEMWPGRFDRIHAAIAASDSQQAMDSVLSLRSSSIMVGAAQLGALADEIVHLLECSHLAAARGKLARLKACGNETAGRLADFCAGTG